MQTTRLSGPMGIGDLLDETVRLYSRNFWLFLSIAAVVEVPLAILQLVQTAIVGPTDQLVESITRNPTLETQLVPLLFRVASGLVLGFLLFIGYIVVSAALTQSISEGYLGRTTTLGGAYRAAFVSFWRLLGAGVLSLLLPTVAGLAIIGVPVAVALILNWGQVIAGVLAALTTLVWLVVFFYVVIRLSLITPAVVLDRAGAWGALPRSYHLAGRHWWRVLAVLLLAGIGQYLVAFIPGTIIGTLVQTALALISPGPSSAYLVAPAILSAFGVLAVPLLPTVVTLLYYDLRVRKEGFDLRLLVDEMGR